MEQSIKLFVPLGTQKFPFNRLIVALNALVENDIYHPNEIMMQSSIYEVTPIFKHCTLIPNEEFNDYIKQSEVIITHSGVNSIISCMKLHKPLIIVPRMKCFGEHVDDHQVEIAELMKHKFNVLVVKDMKDLQQSINIVKKHTYKDWISHSNTLISSIKDIIEQL